MGRLKLTSLGPLLLGSVWLFGAAIARSELHLVIASGALLIAGINILYQRLRDAERSLSEDILSAPASRRPRRGAPTSALELGELLVHHYHWVGERDLARALAMQKRTARPLGEVLIRARLVSPEQVAQVLREHPALQDGPSLGRVSENWTGRRSQPS